ncbi:MAG: glycogen debranching enzyme N-terminal domain-containing protein [Planctomycetota bacterium]
MSHTSTSTKPVLDAGATVPGPEFSIDARGEIAQRRLARTEWVLTIGNGGFAMGTAIGTPRRRFHGLFVPALKPPVSRITALQQMHETIVLRPGTDLEEKIELGSYELVGQPAEEPTSPHLIRFEKDRTAVRWVYEVREVEIIKELRMGFRSSECAVRYAIRANAPCQLRVRPLVSLRAFDQLHGAGKVQRFQVDSDERLCTVRAPTGGEDPNSTQPKYALNLMSDSGSFQESIELLRGVRYEFETERGEEQGVSDWEDLFVPGRFVFSFEGGPAREEVMIAHSIGNIKPNTGLFEERTAQTYLEATIRRATEATPGLGGCAGLIIAADSFLVEREHRGETFMTVIAGYPWFADWGRDAMISLPGLMLSTGRLAEARHCLQTFARHLSRGMIPNNFDESAGPPGYNTVDAALWFLHSACRYLEISGDQKWFDDKLSSGVA